MQDDFHVIGSFSAKGLLSHASISTGVSTIVHDRPKTGAPGRNRARTTAGRIARDNK
ncbi:MAG: hypothetical protein JXQ29_15010 [Planctomycetes bacterium]|nr:hypothetical protein [Planctomycetota bacterium]